MMLAVFFATFVKELALSLSLTVVLLLTAVVCVAFALSMVCLGWLIINMFKGDNDVHD